MAGCFFVLLVVRFACLVVRFACLVGLFLKCGMSVFGRNL